MEETTNDMKEEEVLEAEGDLETEESVNDGITEESGGRISRFKKRRVNKVGLVHSMRFKILISIAVCCILVSAINLFTVIPLLREEITESNRNYILDMTKSASRELKFLVQATGVEQAKNQLSAISENAKLNGVASSYCYIVASDGTMLYHPTKEKIGQPVENEVIKQVAADISARKKVEPKTIEYDFKGATKYSAFAVEDISKFIVVISADKSDILSPVNVAIRRTILTAAIVVILALVIVGLLMYRMLKPMSAITEQVGKFAFMDFREIPENQKFLRRKDEIGVMANATETLRSGLIQVVQDLKEQSSLLHQTSEALKRQTYDTSTMIDQVDDAVREIAEGATAQAGETQAATEQISNMGDMIARSNTNVEEIRGESSQIHDSTLVANETLQQLEQINAKVREAIDEIYEQTYTTNESAINIQEAAALITSIADETSLLSLNASIEAARAGEHGRGFAVVANQIQKLAEQSNDSANRIEAIIDNLLADSKKTVQTMDEVKEIVEKQNESVHKTAEIFHVVEKGIDSSLEGIGDIVADTDKIDKSRLSVTESVQNLTAIAEENAASTEESSASVTQVRNSVDDIAENVDGLNDIASQIEDAMNKFVL